MALLANGADPSLKSVNGATAADWARQAGQEEVAAILQEHMDSEQAASKVAAEAAALSDYQANMNPTSVDPHLTEFPAGITSIIPARVVLGVESCRARQGEMGSGFFGWTAGSCERR